ncbi:MAG: hypothetical protein ACLTS6_16855 [Anaerobutyricum sp.]
MRCGRYESHLCFIDYKTDQIEEGEEQHLLDRYGNQMLYYKAALEQILEKRVSEIYLDSFSLKKFISSRKFSFHKWRVINKLVLVNAIPVRS